MKIRAILDFPSDLRFSLFPSTGTGKLDAGHNEEQVIATRYIPALLLALTAYGISYPIAPLVDYLI
jgi:hypothetical protein